MDEVVGPAGKRKGKGGGTVEVRGGNGDWVWLKHTAHMYENVMISTC